MIKQIKAALAAKKERAAAGQSWREYGFARKWTRCNCGCKAPEGLGGTTAFAPNWFKLVLAIEDFEHKHFETCAIDDGEDVKVWHNDKQVRVGDLAAAA